MNEEAVKKSVGDYIKKLDDITLDSVKLYGPGMYSNIFQVLLSFALIMLENSIQVRDESTLTIMYEDFISTVADMETKFAERLPKTRHKC